jgi:hypothetical protein
MSTIDPPRLGMTFPSCATCKRAQDAWWNMKGDAFYSAWYDVWSGESDYEIIDYIAYCRVCQYNVRARGGAPDGPDSPPSYPNIGMACGCGKLANTNITE